MKNNKNRILVLLLIVITVISLVGCKNKENTTYENKNVLSSQVVATVNKNNFKEYTKSISQILKNSIDTDSPLSSDNIKLVDEYVAKYHGDNYYDESFRKKYSSEDLITMENVWFAAAANKAYFKAKSDNNSDLMKGNKQTVINECAKYIN